MSFKPLRILYAAGPGNVLGTYRHWKEGQDDPTQIAMTYSGQFYDLCRELAAQAYVIATCTTPGRLRDGNIRIAHRPVPFEQSAGILYHLGQFYYGLRLLISAVRMRADVAVVCTGTHWFVLWLMPLFGIRVVPTLHCVLWTKYRWRPTNFQRWVHQLNGWFFGGRRLGIIAVSDEITQQVSELTGGRGAPVTRFVPQYRRASFASVRPPDEARDPFRVLYVGRIERNKGVFDVLSIARQFAADGVAGVEFDLCGAGGALAELRAAIAAAGLSAVVRCHGHCDHATMTEMYSRCHVVIVPTTTDFIEGFNKVVAEGVLAGRPVITSNVCPALALVRGSVVEVPADDAAAYAAAVLRLRDDRRLYQAKRRACTAAEGQFYDPSQGWAASLKTVLAPLSAARATNPARRPRLGDRRGRNGGCPLSENVIYCDRRRHVQTESKQGVEKFMPHPIRILYAAGPGDVLGTYRHWKGGEDDPTQVSMTYSGQFYDVVRELDARAYVIGCNPNRARLRDGNVVIEHRPIPFQHASSALLYHFGQVWSALRLILSAVWFRADLVVIVCGTCHWFPLRVLRLLRVKVVPTMHCVIWRKGHALRGAQKQVARLNRKFFTRTVSAIMSASHDISQQVDEITRGRMRPVHEFLPTYRAEQFREIGAPPAARSPFRVFFAGRVERNKGVFDLLEICKRYAAAGRCDIEFDLCGSGGALADLKAATEQARLAGRFRCHGHCDKATMRDMFARCHAVIVPTTSDFIEGFNQVVAEGVLSGRPVITSNVCPALDYVRDAVVEVPPDDVAGYHDAILKLCDDVAFYDCKTAACHAAQGQFYDPAKSWATTLKNVMRGIGLFPGKPRPDVAWSPSPAAKWS